MIKFESKKNVLPAVKAKLVGKRGLIVGIANENSIVWAVGAEVAVTYVNDKAKNPYTCPLATP